MVDYRLKAAPIVIDTKGAKADLLRRALKDFAAWGVWNFRRLVGARTR